MRAADAACKKGDSASSPFGTSLSSWETQTLFGLTKTKTLWDHRGDRCISWRAKEVRDASSECAPAISGPLLPLSTSGL